MFLIIPSCKQKHAHAGDIVFYNPIEYNDFVVDHQNAIIRHMVQLTQAFDNGTEQEIRMQYKSLTARSDSSLHMISQLSDYEGDSVLKGAAVDLLKFYNQAFHKQYKDMIEIFLKGDAASDAEVETLNQHVIYIRNREDALNTKLNAAQTAFAKKFQFEFDDQTPENFSK
jgi:hypothetical protein